MEVRLFPQPSEDYCTPFLPERRGYRRYACHDGDWRLVTVDKWAKEPKISVDGGQLHQRMPDRDRLLEWICLAQGVREPFAQYASSHVVVPTFSMSLAEALTRVVMRQIVTVRQARKAFAQFTMRFGYRLNGAYGFPDLDTLRELSIGDYHEFGLGFRAQRLHHAIHSLDPHSAPHQSIDLGRFPGIGPWSKAVLDTELNRDYAYYPFSDKSGEAILMHTGIDVAGVATRAPSLAADLYVYAASFVEALRTHASTEPASPNPAAQSGRQPGVAG